MQIEVCLTPALMNQFKVQNKIVVVIDVLRATSTFATALHQGITAIQPVATVEEAQSLAKQGFLTAGERDGKIIEGLAHGNSPTEYMDDFFDGKNLVMTTTNGTKCIALSEGADQVITCAFNNLDKTVEYLRSKNKDILILCSGWKDKFNHEDTWCAGAIVQGLQDIAVLEGDSTTAALFIYEKVQNDLQEASKHISHYKRLLGNGVSIEDVEWCFKKNVAPVVVSLEGKYLKIIS